MLVFMSVQIHLATHTFTITSQTNFVSDFQILSIFRLPRWMIDPDDMSFKQTTVFLTYLKALKYTNICFSVIHDHISIIKEHT